MRDQMRLGDRVLFYHSSANPPAVVGTATVVREAYPDFTAMDPDNDHYDKTHTTENPVWQMVDIRLERIFSQPVTLERLRSVKQLQTMTLLQRGSRLSVQPVTPEEFELVLAVAEELAMNSEDQRPLNTPGGKVSTKPRATSGSRKPIKNKRSIKRAKRK